MACLSSPPGTQSSSSGCLPGALLPLRESPESYPVYRTGAWVDSSKDAVGTPGVSGWGAEEKNRAESDPTLGA